LKSQGGSQIVQGDFHLATAADIVADPSAPMAFVEGIMEGKEWVWDNGILKEAEIQKIADSIEETAGTKYSEEAKVNAFNTFLSKL
jgi:hypothetical protein